MKIAITDDEQAVRQQLTDYVQRYAAEHGIECEVRRFPSGDALLAAFRPEYDILIFDIDMPGTNGINTARQIREQDGQAVILFITNIAQYAINGYEVEALDYIIKPVGYHDFALKFERAVRKVGQQKQDILLLNSTEGIVPVKVQDIICIEANAHYMVYRTDRGTYRVRGSLREHEAEMADRHFSRVQRSFLINLTRVERITSAGVVAGGETYAFGRPYKDSFMLDYMKYLGG